MSAVGNDKATARAQQSEAEAIRPNYLEVRRSVRTVSPEELLSKAEFLYKML